MFSRRQWIGGSSAAAAGVLLGDARRGGQDEVLGDPHGRLLFVGIKSETVPESVVRIRTAGFDCRGVGMATYRIVASSDREALALGLEPNAWTCRARNGLWYALEAGRGEVTLSAFGGRGDGMLAAGGGGGLQAQGGTDNAAAWSAFGNWARAHRGDASAVTLTLEHGVYLYDMSQCWRALLNIPRLRLAGGGSILQNTYRSAASGHRVGASEPFFRAAYPRLSKRDCALIETTREGERQIRLKDKEAIRLFAPSQWILIGSLDVQYFGFPPNMYQFEYLKIAGLEPETGLLHLAGPLRYRHADDFPDGPAPLPCGRARAWSLGTYDDAGAVIGDWDVEHSYTDLQINPPLDGSRAYTTLSGRALHTEDWRGCGFSESIAGQVSHSRPQLVTPGEPDKLVDELLYDGLVLRGLQEGARGRLVFQSPIRNVVIRNAILASGLGLGQARNMTVSHSQVSALYTDAPGTLGLAGSIRVESCRIGDFPQFRNRLWDGSQTLKVDGQVVRYRDGAFLVAGDLATVRKWQCAPGVSLNLLADCGYSGPVGDASIRAVTGLGDGLRIETSLPFTELPAWSTGEVCFFHQNRIEFVACDGAKTVRDASAFCQAGEAYYAGLVIDIDETRGRGRRKLDLAAGGLKRARLSGAKGGGARVSVAFQAFRAPPAPRGPDSQGELRIDFGGGPADVTRSGWIARGAGDTVHLAGRELSALPADRLLGPSFVVDTDVSGAGGVTPASRSLELWFDIGPVRQTA